MQIHSLLCCTLLILAAPIAFPQEATPPLDRDVVATVEGWGKPGDYNTVAPEPDLIPDDWLVLPCAPGESKAICDEHSLGWIRKHPTQGQSVQASDSSHKWTALKKGSPPPSIACAVSEFEVAADEVRMLHAPGLETVWVDGVPFQGDPKHSGFLGSPIALSEGVHRIVAPNPSKNWSVRFWKPRTQVVLAHWATAPKAQTLEDLANPFAPRFVPAYNASLERADPLHVHHGSARSVSKGEPRLSEWRCGESMEPMETTDMYTGDSADSGDLDGSDPLARYMVIAFTTKPGLCSVANASIQVVTKSKAPSFPNGWVLCVPKDKASDRKAGNATMSMDSFAKWYQQRILHDTNAWCVSTHSIYGDMFGFLSRSRGDSKLLLGNCSNNADLAGRFERSKKRSPKSTPPPASVIDGKMLWEGEEFLGPDWFFVYRPNKTTCFALITGPEALPALTLALSQAPTTFASTRPSK